MRLHALLFCHRNVQIQDLQQKICDADQGKGLKIKLYTVHLHSCNLNWLRTKLFLVYLVTEKKSDLWLVLSSTRCVVWEQGESLDLVMTVDVMWKLLVFCIHRLAIISPQKEKWERGCVKNAISLRVSCHVCCNVSTENKGGKSMWESLHTMMEAKCALKWLLEQVTSSKPWLKTWLFKLAFCFFKPNCPTCVCASAHVCACVQKMTGWYF